MKVPFAFFWGAGFSEKGIRCFFPLGQVVFFFLIRAGLVGWSVGRLVGWLVGWLAASRCITSLTWRGGLLALIGRQLGLGWLGY